MINRIRGRAQTSAPSALHKFKINGAELKLVAIASDWDIE